MVDGLRILIVEDEAAILMHLAMMVEDEGHDVVGTATNSRHAIALLESEKPDLILLDLHLADGSTGVAVAQSAFAAEIDVIFMTANASQVEAIDGALGVLAKPFSQTGVLGTLRFLAECILDPPPKLSRPSGFMMAATLAKRAGLPH